MTTARLKLPSEELNRVLGGGIVAGSVALLAGEPGVGKSTLLLQLARYLSESGRQVTYLSGEESPHQVKLRSERLGFSGDGVFLVTETDVDLALARPGGEQARLRHCRLHSDTLHSGCSLRTRQRGPGAGVRPEADALGQAQ